MDRDTFRERLLEVMERKAHWAWPAFTSGKVPKGRLHVHLEQEYAVYVRDFPVLVGRAYVQCPIAEVRRELAENIYEEETGRLSGTRPHPELFLEYPRGLGMDVDRFAAVELLPAAARYREAIDDATVGKGWAIAAAVTTLFLEGTPHERGEVEEGAERRPMPPLEEHPLVVHYGLPIASLALTKAHRSIEGEHRGAAWRTMLHHVAEGDRPEVIREMQALVPIFQAYRDEIAFACGLDEDAHGEPILRA